MEQFKVRVVFNNGVGFTAWFDTFNIHRNEQNNQVIEGVEYLLSDPNEAVPFMRLEDITFIQLIERRFVSDAEAVEVAQ